MHVDEARALADAVRDQGRAISQIGSLNRSMAALARARLETREPGRGREGRGDLRTEVR